MINDDERKFLEEFKKLLEGMIANESYKPTRIRCGTIEYFTLTGILKRDGAQIINGNWEICGIPVLLDDRNGFTGIVIDDSKKLYE